MEDIEVALIGYSTDGTHEANLFRPKSSPDVTSFHRWDKLARVTMKGTPRIRLGCDTNGIHEGSQRSSLPPAGDQSRLSSTVPDT